MNSYHLLDIESFDYNRKEYATAQQLSTGNSDPISKITRTVPDFYGTFDKYELFHESKKRQHGRAYGRPDSFDSFINQKSFDCYLWKDKNIFIFEASKDAVNASVKRLSKTYGKTEFSMKRGSVDFEKVLKRATNITGGWFGSITGNVNSVGLFGDHVNLSLDYNRYSAAGELSALTIEVDINGDIHSFMITKERTIVLYKAMSIERKLTLISQIYTQLL